MIYFQGIKLNLSIRSRGRISTGNNRYLSAMVIAVNCRLLQKNRLEGIGWFTFETLKRITVAHPEHQFLFIFDRPWAPEFIFSENITPIVAGFPRAIPSCGFYGLNWSFRGCCESIKLIFSSHPMGCFPCAPRSGRSR